MGTDVTEPEAHESYDPALFPLLFDVEAHHFWFRARNRALAAVLKELVDGMGNDYRVLEVGCGTGYVLSMLKSVCENGTVVGMDLFTEGLRLARRRASAVLVRGDMHSPPFGPEFNLVGLFDVLEHVHDDQQVLHLLRALLSKGGKLVITVPAHPNLWSYFDEASHHVRRYERAELERKLQETGYEIERTTYLMSMLLPLVWLRRKLAVPLRFRRMPSRSVINNLAARELHVTPVVNKVLYGLMSLESCLLARERNLRWGTSLLIVARRSHYNLPSELIARSNRSES